MKILAFAFMTLCASCFCKEPEEVICSTEYVYGLHITFKNASTNEVVTEGLTVIATENDYEETLMNDPGSDVFYGAGDRPGNYIITVTSDNYQTFISGVIPVGGDVCHVFTESLEITLQPN